MGLVLRFSGRFCLIRFAAYLAAIVNPPRRYAPPLPKGELDTVSLRDASTTKDQGGASKITERSCQYALRAWKNLRKRQFRLRRASSASPGKKRSCEVILQKSAARSAVVRDRVSVPAVPLIVNGSS